MYLYVLVRACVRASMGVGVCVCACVRARARVCVRVCLCVHAIWIQRNDTGQAHCLCHTSHTSRQYDTATITFLLKFMIVQCRDSAS